MNHQLVSKVCKPPLVSLDSTNPRTVSNPWRVRRIPHIDFARATDFEIDGEENYLDVEKVRFSECYTAKKYDTTEAFMAFEEQDISNSCCAKAAPRSRIAFIFPALRFCNRKHAGQYAEKLPSVSEENFTFGSVRKQPSLLVQSAFSTSSDIHSLRNCKTSVTRQSGVPGSALHRMPLPFKVAPLGGE